MKSLRNTGTIEVILQRVQVIGRRNDDTYAARESFQHIGPVHEKALKGSAISHNFRYCMLLFHSPVLTDKFSVSGRSRQPHEVLKLSIVQHCRN